jgi:probable phosphoglycerate mutase
VIGNWQQTFAELGKTAGAHLIVTSNGIARFALLAAGVARPDAKLATGAYGVVEVGADSETVRGWNIRPTG